MKITTYLTTIKRMDADASGRYAYLGFRLREKGIDIKVRSEIIVDQSLWDAEANGYRRSRKMSDENRQKTANLVHRIMAALAEEFDEATACPSWAKSVIARCLRPKEEKPATATAVPTFADRMKTYIEEKIEGRTVTIYTPVLKTLQRYEAYMQQVKGKENFHLYVETITAEDYHNVIEYAANEHKLIGQHPEFYAQFNFGRYAPRQKSDNGKFAFLVKLRAIHHWCIRQGITNNTSCNDYTLPTPVYGTPVYISLEERDRLFGMDLSGQSETIRLCRDLFVFQSLIGCRVGDLFSFTRDNIHDDVLEFVPQKTRKRLGRSVQIPLNAKAKEILSRYHCDDGRLFPKMAVSTYNCSYGKAIKKLFRICGITRMVTVRDLFTGEDEQKPICDIASSHMARRTFIGNLYKKVRDPQLVGSLTGHVNGSRSFARYRDIDEEIKQDLVNLIN